MRDLKYYCYTMSFTKHKCYSESINNKILTLHVTQHPNYVNLTRIPRIYYLLPFFSCEIIQQHSLLAAGCPHVLIACYSTWYRENCLMPCAWVCRGDKTPDY